MKISYTQQYTIVIPDNPTFIVHDNKEVKVVASQVNGSSFTFILWDKTVYDTCGSKGDGNYTQADFDAASLAYVLALKVDQTAPSAPTPVNLNNL